MSRFIKSAVATSKKDHPAMPWQRGARRAAFVAKRKGEKPELKRA